MKALIIQTMLALLIPGLSNTPKTLLTPPANYNYSYGLQSGTQDPIWYFKNHSNNQISSITYTRELVDGFYSYDSGYFHGLPTMDIRFRFYGTQSAWFEYGGGRYEPWYNYIGTYTGVSSSSVKYQFNFDNFGQYNYRVYFDVSSSSGAYSNYYSYGFNLSDNAGVNFLYPNILRSVIVPAFSGMTFFTFSDVAKIDAIYFEQLPITQGMDGYGSENYNEGYNEGYTTAYDEFGNFDWLSSLFTTMGDLLAIEILPGITIGLILLIPIVFGVLRFIMGLFR